MCALFLRQKQVTVKQQKLDIQGTLFGVAPSEALLLLLNFILM